MWFYSLLFEIQGAPGIPGLPGLRGDPGFPGFPGMKGTVLVHSSLDANTVTEILFQGTQMFTELPQSPQTVRVSTNKTSVLLKKAPQQHPTPGGLKIKTVS